MSEERVANPDAKRRDIVLAYGLRRLIPFTRKLALASSELDSWQWRLHIAVSNMWSRAVDRITIGIWS